jgi:plasmid stabilization system protein ParE
MRLRFTPRAVEDLAAISDYLKARSPSAALKVRHAIYASLELLLLFPSIGRRQKTEGVRKLVTSRFGYLVYYSIDAAHDEIIVLAVKHPAREREHEDA